MSARPVVACVGVYILDVLGRAIDTLPTVQRSLVIDEIRMTVAGTAGGTAVDLARLDLQVRAVGAVGDDTPGEFVRTLLDKEGVDTAGLITRSGTPTSATILPISTAGVRPAWHVRGANAVFGPEDIADDALDGVDVVHYGGVSALPGLDGRPCRDLLARAKSGGAITTADCLGVKRDDALELLTPALPYLDVFVPNQDELRQLTGCSDVVAGARLLRDHGAAAVVVKMDAEGCYAVSDNGEFTVAALDVDVVDSTGCGDAFCAGLIRGLTFGWDLERAARLATVCGALTVGGLGSDAGIRDLDSTLAAARTHFG